PRGVRRRPARVRRELRAGAPRQGQGALGPAWARAARDWRAAGEQGALRRAGRGQLPRARSAGGGAGAEQALRRARSRAAVLPRADLELAVVLDHVVLGAAVEAAHIVANAVAVLVRVVGAALGTVEVLLLGASTRGLIVVVDVVGGIAAVTAAVRGHGSPPV